MIMNTVLERRKSATKPRARRSYRLSSRGIDIIPRILNQTAYTTANEGTCSSESGEITFCTPEVDILTQALEILRQNTAIPVNEELVLFKALRTDDVAVGSGTGSCNDGIWSADGIDDLRRNIINRIVKQNLPLVFRMRMRFPVDGLDLDEMLSEGSLALYRAAKGFDPERGFRFSTYACRSIRYAFVGMAKKQQREQEALKLLAKERPVTAHWDDLELHIDRQILLDKVNAVLAAKVAGLKEAESFVIKQRFLTASTDKPRTLASIGRTLRISKERVRQIELRAVAKLRVALFAHTFSDNYEGLALVDMY